MSLTLRGKEPVRVKEESRKPDLSLTLRKDMSSWVKGKGRKQRMSHEVNGEENRRKTGRKNDTGYGLERIQTRKRI